MKERLEAKFQEALKERNESAKKAREFHQQNLPEASKRATEFQCLEQGKMEAYAQVLWDEFGTKYSITSGEKES